MTFIYELDLYALKLHPQAKNVNVFESYHIADGQTYMHTDRQTDRQTDESENIKLPRRLAGGNNANFADKTPLLSLT